MIRVGHTFVNVQFFHGKMEKTELAIDLRKEKERLSRFSLGAKEQALRQMCATALAKAEKEKKQAVVLLPCVIEGVPIVGLTRIITQQIYYYLTRHVTSLRKITIGCVDKKLHQIFKKEVEGYLKHLIQTLAGEPYVTVDVIIEMPQGIVIIERSNPPFGWALPGGFVDRDESLEVAVRREAKEETNLTLKHLRQFHTYSDPSRDPRFHTIDTVFVAKGVGNPQSGDDAKNLKIIPYDKLLDEQDYAFDHKEIIEEYLKQKSENS
jgi:8-oxo-dGTP diphosphatase